ncbi:hypothetical protein QQ008_13360 [Fulvivirgaceae bacterium BMA10]|uniref:Outer membrane protein beta-barrel domain-containing protein n=1 Tax=Splendidivirga corallicola TaxID=3051826 RepID=A0ABT8KRW6_9BACT|nr:hypothetical protein [Fulvivirgaceae bacterium BMA10]
MDDSKFDNLIKGKVGEYEPPGFDPSALASLHHQMAATKAWPWHVRYRTELMVGAAAVLLAILILWSQWFMGNRTTEMLEKQILTLKNQNEQIDQLRQEIDYWKSVRPDTVRITQVNEQDPLLYASLIDRINQLTAIRSTTSAIDDEVMFLGSEEEIPSDLFELLMREGYVKRDGKHIYLVASPGKAGKLQPMGVERMIQQKEQIIRLVGLHQVREELSVDKKEQFISLKTMKELDKHYGKGVGIKIGPSFELSGGAYDSGDGRIDFGAGLLADFIVSPSLSIETGAKYIYRTYEVFGENELSQLQLPNVDESVSKLIGADIESKILEIPLNLKYRRPLSLRTNAVIGVGYSSMLYLGQVFEYDHEFNDGGNSPGSQNFTISSRTKDHTTTFYPGTLNISLGASRQLRNTKVLETSVYYQRGLGKKGIEKIDPSFFGVRGVYWFSVR